jgi:hypothetical protein
LSKSLVFVQTTVKEPSGHITEEDGTGFFVSAGGYILTAGHLLSTNPQATTQVTLRSVSDTRRLKATPFPLPGSCCDLALLKVSETEGPFVPVQFGDPSRVSVGDPLLTLGFTFGQDLSLLTGSLASKDAAIGNSSAMYPFIGSWRVQTPLNGGDSGAPVYDGAGHGVIAIGTGGVPTAQGYGLVTPITFAYPLLLAIGEAGRLPTSESSIPLGPATHPVLPHSDTTSSGPSPITVTTVTPVSAGLTVEEVPAFDWSDATMFHITNNAPIYLPGGVINKWGIGYEISGVYKVESAGTSVDFRIDSVKLQLGQTSTSVNTTILQIGICHDVQGPPPATWDIYPNPARPASARSLNIKVEKDKKYTQTGIAAVVIVNDGGLDLRKSWPCSLLWTDSGGNFPAHQDGRQAIL